MASLWKQLLASKARSSVCVKCVFRLTNQPADHLSAGWFLFIPVLFFFVTSFKIPTDTFINVSYLIEDKSSLSIAGTTNVNSFDCACKEKFARTSANVTFDDASKTMLFDHTSLSLHTTSLDCDNDKMNADLQEAMKADVYPYISVDLSSAKIVNGSLTGVGDNATLKTEAYFTITNVKRKVSLDVKATRISDSQYRFVSTANFKMTDYGIKPPTVLFGLIKVRDNISINFDLMAKTLQ